MERLDRLRTFLTKELIMEKWQERVIKELEALHELGDKLYDFVSEEGGVFDALLREDQHLLIAQLTFMAGYSEALEERIARWT